MTLAEPGPAPLHQRIRADIEGMILSGTLRPGERIPVEHELMARYGCARMTVNKALSALADAGLIERRKRAGSFVSSPKIHIAALAIPDIQAEIVGRGMTYGMELQQRALLPAAEVAADRMVLKRGGRALLLRCRHLADGAPFALEERLINLAAVPEAESVDFSTVPPGSWLLSHVPWTEAEHRIAAIQAGADGAGLGLTLEAACLLLDRRTWRQTPTGPAPVTAVRQLFPGAMFDLVARFSGG